MTEQEAIEIIKIFPKWNLDDQWLDEDEMQDLSEMVIAALEEIQKYRALGTVAECRAAVEGNKIIALLESDTLKEAVKTYGAAAQTDMAIEEMSELMYDGRIKGQMTLDTYQELTAAQAPVAAAYSPEAAAEQPPTGKPLDLKNRNKPAENNGDPAGALAAGNDFDPETGEILDGAANEAQNKIVPIGSKAANA